MDVSSERPALHLPDSLPPVLDGEGPLDQAAIQALTLQRIALGAGWLQQATGPDGWFSYYYRPAIDRVYMDDYNDVRHAGVTYSMFQAYGAIGDPKLLDAAERAIGWIDAASAPTPYSGKAYGLNNLVVVGGQSLALIALLERRRMLQDTAFDDLIADLTIFLELLELPDKPGQYFEVYRPASDRFRTTSGPTYSPGEILLALCRLAQHFPDGPFLDAAERVASYLIFGRDGDILDAGLAASMDHWMALGLSELYLMTSDPRHAEAAFLIGDLMRDAQYKPGDASWRLLGASRRGTSANYTGTATKGEAFLALWDLAIHVGNQELVDRYSNAALRNVQFLMRVQYTEEIASRFRNPEKVVGGWAQDEVVSDIRMDYVQHSLSAIVGAWNLLAHGRQSAVRQQSQPGAELALRVSVAAPAVYEGPNLYSVNSTIAFVVDPRKLPSLAVPGELAIRKRVNELVSELRGDSSARLPDRIEQEQSIGPDPDDIGQALALIVKEVQLQSGWKVSESGSRPLGNGTFEVYCQFTDRLAALAAVEVGVAVLEDLINGRRRSETQGRKNQDQLLDPEFPQNLGVTPRLVREARRRGIRTFERTDKAQFLEFGTGSYQKTVRKAVTSESKVVSHQIARDKNRASLVLQEAGLPAPRNRRVRSADAAVKAADRIGYPIVLKPLDGSQAMGVYPGIRDAEGVRECFAGSKAYSRNGDVIVEQYLEGESYRIFVVADEVIGALERRPAEIVGDGEHTVRALIELENLSPARQPRPDNYLAEINVDEQSLLALEWQSLTMDSVPEEGKVVRLKLIPSGSNGGTRVDRLADMHPDNIEIARQAARTVDLAVSGLDFVTPDITRSVWEVGGGIVEINGAPAFYPHYRTTAGRSFDPVVQVLEMLYPGNSPSQIRAIGMTGVPNPAAVSRVIETAISTPDRHIGVANGDGSTIQGVRVGTVHSESPTPLQVVVRNPLIDTAILVPKTEDFNSPGLEFDRFDVVLIGPGPELTGDYGTLMPVELLAMMTADSGVIVIDVNAPRQGHISVSQSRVMLTSSSGMTKILEDHLASNGEAVVAIPADEGTSIQYLRGAQEEVVLDAGQTTALVHADGGIDLESLLQGIAAGIAFGVIPEQAALNILATRTETAAGRIAG